METVRVKHGTTERIFATVSNSSGVPVTGLTDVLLEIYRKSDGKYFDFNDSAFKASGWTTQAGVMTEMDATYSPGVYYYDFDTTNHSSQFVEETYFMTVNSATGANDPLYGELKVGGFVDQIGMVGGVMSYGKGKGMTDAQIKKMAELVWQVVLKNEKTAEATLLSKSEFNAVTDKVLVDFPKIEFPETVDRTDEVLSAVSNIEKPKDYTKAIQSVGQKMDNFVPVMKDLGVVVDKMNISLEEVDAFVKAIPKLQEGYEKLSGLQEEYGQKLADATDMDKRFDAMASALNKRNLEEVAKDIQKTQEELKQ